MALVNNVRVYGLENSFRVSKFPMTTDTEKCSDKITPTIKSLAGSDIGTGHDNFLQGIVVQFDLTFTIKAWTEAERYHFFDIVSSQSTMHKITQMDLDTQCCEYVDEAVVVRVKELIEQYKEDSTPENYLKVLYSVPVGLKLTAGITTNYRQLKTMYQQRRNHRLPEWKEFCTWIGTLPYAKELIVGG